MRRINVDLSYQIYSARRSSRERCFLRLLALIRYRESYDECDQHSLGGYNKIILSSVAWVLEGGLYTANASPKNRMMERLSGETPDSNWRCHWLLGGNNWKAKLLARIIPHTYQWHLQLESKSLRSKDDRSQAEMVGSAHVHWTLIKLWSLPPTYSVLDSL